MRWLVRSSLKETAWNDDLVKLSKQSVEDLFRKTNYDRQFSGVYFTAVCRNQPLIFNFTLQPWLMWFNLQEEPFLQTVERKPADYWLKFRLPFLFPTLLTPNITFRHRLRFWQYFFCLPHVQPRCRCLILLVFFPEHNQHQRRVWVPELDRTFSCHLCLFLSLSLSQSHSLVSSFFVMLSLAYYSIACQASMPAVHTAVTVTVVIIVFSCDCHCCRNR